MNDQRKKIIIAEIETWRKNNLIPEHYCIFLLNLYTEGERPVGDAARTIAKKAHTGTAAYGTERLTSGTANHAGSAGISVSWKLIFAWFAGACFIAAMILSAFHFSDFSTPMQIAIFSIFALIFYLMAVIFRRSLPILGHIGLGGSFLILIIGGVYLLRSLGYGTGVLLGFLTIVCLLWLVNGLFFRYSYLLYCGFLGLAMIYGLAVSDRLAADFSWWKVELYWVPIALLMLGLGFLWNERNQQLAGVLAICGLLFFFGSEVEALYIPAAKTDVIQLLLFLKVFLGAVFFFFTRKYWFGWLRL
ncbi:hypothetical protein [Brevibacillus fulvus]|uniref:DUF2157 domain-containing protein n=1 Tax=Brevibacillus fulvus TaxID=1125967 RepID=A0A938Y1F1_9BACL|nr:hypothetical protein [Brevibacillus fulvus]MBM7589842.1 hypothetical protein [Brevibacillus fulvus]